MDIIYPLSAIVCSDCGYAGALWEKSGTGVPYVRYCPSCGKRLAPDGKVVIVEDKEEHLKLEERVNQKTQR